MQTPSEHAFVECIYQYRLPYQSSLITSVVVRAPYNTSNGICLRDGLRHASPTHRGAIILRKAPFPFELRHSAMDGSVEARPCHNGRTEGQWA